MSYLNYNTNKPNSQRIKEKIQKLQIKKNYNNKIVDMLENNNKIPNNKSRAEKIKNCSSTVGLSIINDNCVFTVADFCKDRLCFICSWRRQVKFLAQSNIILQKAIENNYNFVFATFTIPNCNNSVEDVNKSIDKIQQSFYTLMRVTRIKRTFLGAIKSIEITYNAENNTFHPHIHCLFLVENNYFKKNNCNYIKQDFLQDLWSKITGFETAICDIRRVYNNRQKACLELIKYALKPTLDENAIEIYARCLKNRRLISFSGKFSLYRKLLKFTPIDEIDTETTRYNSNINTILFKFNATGGIYEYFDKI